MLTNDFEQNLANHSKIFNSVDPSEIDYFVELLRVHQPLGSIVGLGAGRMGYSLRAFVMRLSHIGFNSFMIGDTSVPRIASKDLVVVNSSSGHTPSILLLCQQAHDAGAKIVVVTGSKESPIAKLADLVVSYDVISDQQMMKTVAEQFTFLFFDYIAHKFVIQNELDLLTIERNHSILE